MIKGFKKQLLGIIGLSVLLLSLGTSAYADVTEQKVEVVGSGLRVFQTALKFDDIRLDVKKSQASKAETTMTVIDGRGSDAGWTVSMSSTDFEIEKSVNGTLEKFYIPASAVEITTDYKGPVTGATINFGSGQGTLSSKLIVSNAPQSIIQAKPSFGGGTHQFNVRYDLKLPQTISKQDGTKIGVLQGSYKALFKYQATSGI
ncbi:WxL domain-containing protein [Paenibacillus glucanolyticus]|uniref:WxL domain-containing protein n=1 Tax=Paenibacillus glucanolyticus TaxID=59843 RepID=A0A163G7M6_9BACL|nr:MULTISPECIES: WxL domain-containing protein [Paenibacillus]KZS44777.1 hypothetical protein AWU65_01945 [Paenibacillus glucanolyticus]MDH6675698.1 hypothetical protein [Paenibacillus sp. LBL]OMF64442.1 hypothetical protein BK142_31835 [Paenibacillus glucanolyticus]